MKKYVVFFLLLVVFIGYRFVNSFSSFDVSSLPSKSSQIAANYLISKNYHVHKYLGKIVSYNFERERLNYKEEMDIWGVQSIPPDNYLGQTITVQSFVISHHPLDDASTGQAIASVFLANDVPIGGYSSSYKGLNRHHLFGRAQVSDESNSNEGDNYYSIDGKTLETVQGTDYKNWKKKWETRYGETRYSVWIE